MLYIILYIFPIHICILILYAICENFFGRDIFFSDLQYFIYVITVFIYNQIFALCHHNHFRIKVVIKVFVFQWTYVIVSHFHRAEINFIFHFSPQNSLQFHRFRCRQSGFHIIFSIENFYGRYNSAQLSLCVIYNLLQHIRRSRLSLCSTKCNQRDFFPRSVKEQICQYSHRKSYIFYHNSYNRLLTAHISHFFTRQIV